MEQLRNDMKKFAEGLGGRLDAIVLELQDSRKDVNGRFLDHDLALRDHGRRITALEQSG